MPVKKDVAYYMGLFYAHEVTSNPSGGFVISVNELPGCLSQGDTVEDATARMREVMAGWFAICIEDGIPIPEPLLIDS
jgi:antitoxin HicB